MFNLWESDNNIKLIMAIVPQGKADILTRAAIEAGVTGGTVGRALGTAKSTFLQILGFCDSAKEVIFIVTPGSIVSKVLAALNDATLKYKRPFGVMCTVDVGKFFISGVVNTVIESAGETVSVNDSKAAREDFTMDKGADSANVLGGDCKFITFIVNRGYSDVVMDAARGAGATGGTVITARGTANPKDEKFFGLDIVPEKDMVLILCKEDIAQKIITTVSALKELGKKGSGVAFTMDAHNFTLLGSK